MKFSIIDHEITLKILEFILNAIEKVKLGFLLSSMCMSPESNGTKSKAHSFSLSKFRHFADQNRPKENKF